MFLLQIELEEANATFYGLYLFPLFKSIFIDTNVFVDIDHRYWLFVILSKKALDCRDCSGEHDEVIIAGDHQ
jgi:hypothetical protein